MIQQYEQIDMEAENILQRIHLLDGWNGEGRLLCRTYPPEEQSKGGIALPGASKILQTGKAWVVKTSPAAKNFNPGDTVIMSAPAAQAGTDIVIAGEILFYLNVSDVACHLPA